MNFTSFLFIRCCESWGGLRQQCRNLTKHSLNRQRLFPIALCRSSQKMMSPLFRGCPSGGHMGSALCSQKLGRAGIWNVPAAFAIPFPVWVSRSHKSHVSSHLFIDCKCLPFLHICCVCVCVCKFDERSQHSQTQTMTCRQFFLSESLLPVIDYVSHSVYMCFWHIQRA